MLKVVWVAMLGAFVAFAQQPSVQQEELPKPGQTQPAQPAAPKPAPQQAPQATPPAPAQPAEQPAAQPTAAAPQAPATPPPAPNALVQHTPAPEESERRQSGKPVAAFWTVLPGR